MFAERLRELRKKKDLTQLELSIKIGVGKSTIAGYEKGIRKPKQEALKKMAKLFNTSVDYLLGVTDDKTPSELSKDLAQILSEDDYTYKGNKVSNKDLDFLIQYLERINSTPINNPTSSSNSENNNGKKYETHSSDERQVTAYFS